jgi:phosphopantothenoylcysteine decarboxylase/phosphopantothenate--cysteine ligase
LLPSYSKYYVEDGKWYDNLLLALLSAKSCLFCSRNGFRYVQASLYKATFKALNEFGNTIIPAESGELASGLWEGRMAEPSTILSFWKLI